MGMTISEKILARASGQPSARAGDIVWAKVDKAMMDDILGLRVEIAEKLKLLGAKIWDPERVTIISDHYTPPANAKQAEIVKFTREWAADNGVEHYYEFAGPCHQVMVEQGRVAPGEVVVGTDSHTCTYGALGAFATGIGSTEMLGVLATGEIWLKVPQTIRLRFDGALQPGVMAKDVALKAIGAVGHNGATYKAMEFCGTTFQSMIMDERLCVANMAVEAGAKNGLIPYDGITQTYLRELGVDGGYPYESDPDAVYCQDLHFDAGSLEPLCACPHEVDNVAPVRQVSGVAIHQAYLGSCTGGRYHDLAQAAALLRGKKIAKGIRLLVSPASREIWERCAREGILTSLSEAGATVLGSGSSRETAPLTLRALGIKTIVAQSYARIFYRNCINLGILAVECAGTGSISEGDQLEIDYQQGVIHDRTTGEELPCDPIPDHIMELVARGGLVEYLKERIQKNA